MLYSNLGSAGQNAGSAFSNVDLDSFDRRERIDNNEAFCYKYIPQSEIRSNGRKPGAIPRIPSKRTTSSRQSDRQKLPSDQYYDNPASRLSLRRGLSIDDQVLETVLSVERYSL